MISAVPALKSRRIGITKAIDRLPRVSHEKEIARTQACHQGKKQFVLEKVGVLELIYHDIPEPLCKGGPHMLICKKRSHAQLEVLVVQAGQEQSFT